MTDTIPAAATGLPNRRRAFLRQRASVTLVGGAVALAADRADAASTSPDAELIALGAELRTAWAIERDAYARHEGIETPEAEEILGAFVEATHTVVIKIEVLKATTMEGLKVRRWRSRGLIVANRSRIGISLTTVNT
jgi:hypothetical protein